MSVCMCVYTSVSSRMSLYSVFLYLYFGIYMFIHVHNYTIIYLGSIIFGNLMSLVFINGNIISCGASIAIFGLLGSLLYFGYY